MRVLVTGAAGQLGRELMEVLPAAGHRAAGVDLECDIASPEAMRSALREHEPDAVVNCAAYTRVDDAERDVDLAYRVNALGPRVLAAECHAAGVRLCHISTDYVFDGEKGTPYDEWDEPRPLGVYGRSKLAGELEVRQLCPDHLVVRTSWLFGRDGPNFVLTMLRVDGEGREMRVVADQTGCPTWTGHLAPALVRLLDRGIRGVVHLCGSGETSWHGLAQAAVAAAGYQVTVAPLRTEDYPTRAARPRNSVLRCGVTAMLGEPPLPSWQDGVAEYIASRPRVRS